MWAMAAQAVMGFASSWYQSYIQKAQYDAQNTINQANADSQNLVNTTNANAANSVRTANNGFLAAQASLQNAQRSIGNSAKLTQFGTQWNALEENQGRIMDSMVRGSLATQLKGAATLGALRAQAASRGVGGASANILRSISSIAFGQAQTQASDNSKYVNFDALIQKAGLLRASVGSLDMGQSLPQVDYGTNVAPLVQAPINPSDYIHPLSSGLGGALSSVIGGGSLNTFLNGLGSTKLAGVGTSGGASMGDMLSNSGAFSGSSTYYQMA